MVALHNSRLPRSVLQSGLGLGLGGLAGGLLVTVGQSETFTRLFLLNAATFFIYLGFLLRLPETRVERTAAGSGYGEVIRDRAFRGLAVVNFLLVAGGIAQLPIARVHEGHRRMTGLALTGTLFALTWMLVLAASTVGPTPAVAVLVVAVLAFAIGECLYDTVLGPLVADLAPADLRSRYMAVNGLRGSSASSPAPASAGCCSASAAVRSGRPPPPSASRPRSPRSRSSDASRPASERPRRDTQRRQ